MLGTPVILYVGILYVLFFRPLFEPGSERKILCRISVRPARLTEKMSELGLAEKMSSELRAECTVARRCFAVGLGFKSF